MSCISLAGWSCGTNRLSKSQKLVCTIVPSISLNPRSSHILFMYSIAWFTKCLFPPYVAGTFIFMSYLLKLLFFQLASLIILGVSDSITSPVSVTFFAIFSPRAVSFAFLCFTISVLIIFFLFLRLS